jgi:5-methylcytosine-specific restriction protein B
LKGNKVSLSNLAAWIFRFTGFDFETVPNEKQFTRVVEKAIRKFFKITKNDFLWLFDNDLSVSRLTPSTTGITGEQIRECFVFEDSKKPEVEFAEAGSDTQKSFVDRDVVERYLALNGDNPSDSDIFDILMSKKQIVLTGVPGVGKSRYTQALCDNPFFGNTKTIQFHASYSYEDFIGAEILKTSMDGTYVTTRKGAFLDFANEAMKNPDENYLFVIDELNRGNIAEIFGETILALDRNYTVSLTREYEDVSELHLPDNMYIVATMNTSDRNIAFLDLAIRRRFAFVPLTPNYDFLSEEVILERYDLGNVLRIINQRIVDTLKDPELILGQSYFIPPKSDDGYVWDFEKFKNQFNFVLLPTIKEYSFNEPSAVNTILGENLGDGIQDTDEFKVVFGAEFSA